MATDILEKIKSAAQRPFVGRIIASADEYNLSREWNRAAELYKQALAVNPALGHIWIQYGHCMKELGSLHDAESAYRKATEASNQDADAQLHLGHCLKQQNRPKEALSAYAKAYELDGTNSEARMEMLALQLLVLPHSKSGAHFQISSGSESFLDVADFNVGDFRHPPEENLNTEIIESKYSLPVNLEEYSIRKGVDINRAFIDYCGNPNSPEFTAANNISYVSKKKLDNLSISIRKDLLSPFFDELFYLQNYRDIRARALHPLEHYCFYGWREGRDPSPQFSTIHYIANVPELARDGICPLLHYALIGRRSGVATAKSTLLPMPVGDGERHNITFEPNARLVSAEEMRRFAFTVWRDLKSKNECFDPNRLRLHWVVPDFAPGAGGHMTIFRICQQLEARGHEITIWIRDPSFHRSSSDAAATINRSFVALGARVSFVGDGLAEAEGDIIFATDAFTMPSVGSVENFKRRFYLVQDFEPAFEAMGARSLLSESTYKKDVDCLCAGAWLTNTMERKYGRWARSFSLAADTSVYSVQVEDKVSIGIPRIAFYSRMFTSRRAVELGLLALEILAARNIKFHVDFFGQDDLPFKAAPFSAHNHGVCRPEKLAEIYRQATLGVVFSATNYSLVPQEMMACGLPVVELDVESTQAVFPPGVVATARPTPQDIADTIARMLLGGPEVLTQAKTASEWVSKFSWSASAEAVESACIERLQELSFSSVSRAPVDGAAPFATVMIPTFNGIHILPKVIEAIERQIVPGEVEILCIDSGSTDGTQEYLRERKSVRFLTIDNRDFQHGRTRNLGVENARSEYVAFLTQDALPANEMWLFNLVTVLINHPNVGGVFGRHTAYPEVSPFIRREINEFMASFDNLPQVIDPAEASVRGQMHDDMQRRGLHFYSDNNSCLRKSIWKDCPIPNIDFGEDQAFAWNLLSNGYAKGYARNALVYHSHDDEPAIVRRRACEEATFFYTFFGYRAVDNLHSARIEWIQRNDRDRQWAREDRIPAAVLDRRLKQNRAVIEGQVDAMVNVGLLSSSSTLDG